MRDETSSAVPDDLRRYAHGVRELNAGVRADAGRLADALSQLAASSHDFVPALPDLPGQLHTLAAGSDQLAERTGTVGEAFRAAGGRGGDALVRVRDATLVRALDPQAAALADRLLALAHPDADIDDIYDDLAALLAEVNADPARAQAVFTLLSGRDLLGLLDLVYDAHLRKRDEHYQPSFRDRGPATELLAPLAEAFAAAARAGVISEGFMDTLTGAHPPVVAQLLLFGEPWAVGNAVVTAGLASVVLADGFTQATAPLWSMHSPWSVGEPFDKTVSFSPETEIYRALEALADLPEAAYRFLSEAGNQAALLNRAADGYGRVRDTTGLRHLPSEVLEAGLLVHPLDAGILVDADGNDLPLSPAPPTPARCAPCSRRSPGVTASTSQPCTVWRWVWRPTTTAYARRSMTTRLDQTSCGSTPATRPTARWWSPSRQPAASAHWSPPTAPWCGACTTTPTRLPPATCPCSHVRVSV